MNNVYVEKDAIEGKHGSWWGLRICVWFGIVFSLRFSQPGCVSIAGTA